MKSKILFLLLLAIGACYSCESFNEDQVILLPANMTATIVEGTEAKKIIADFNYIPGTNRLDHITWSNHQTHYFEYDASDRIAVVRQMKVDAKVQEEQWFHYDGSLVERIILVKRNLDYSFLEPLDSIYVGYVKFDYEGKDIIEEKRYEMSEDGKKQEVVWKVSYAYDGQGNILSSTSSDPRTKSSQSIQMSYDNNKHPFSELAYYFTGESFVNNLMSKTIEQEDFEYDYDLRLNEYGYPETIFEKLGYTNTRIIRYTYLAN